MGHSTSRSGSVATRAIFSSRAFFVSRVIRGFWTRLRNQSGCRLLPPFDATNARHEVSLIKTRGVVCSLPLWCPIVVSRQNSNSPNRQPSRPRVIRQRRRCNTGTFFTRLSRIHSGIFTCPKVPFKLVLDCTKADGKCALDKTGAQWRN